MFKNPLQNLKHSAQQWLAMLLMVLISGLTFLHVIAHKRQQKEVKRYLERSVGMSLSEDLFLPLTPEFEHIKKGDEIVFGGQKYDLLKVTRVSNGYWVKAFNDKVEKALEDQIAQQCERGSGGSSKAHPIWFDKLHWAVNDEIVVLLGPPAISQSINRMSAMDLTEGVASVSVPPPRG